MVKYLINIIKSVLNGKKFVPGEDFGKVDFEKLYTFSRAHHLAAFVACCPAALGKMPPELAKKFRYELNINIAKETAQTVKIGAFLEEMEKAGLRAMPIKGYFLKNLYPVPALRYMTDTDILVDENRIDEIKPIMEKLGFKYDHETVHELIFMSPQLVVELHKVLIPEHKSLLRDYYADGWRLAQKQEGKEFLYKFSKEDLYIYTIGHIAKHYSDGGIGITHVMDVYLQNKQELDLEYIKAELEKLGLGKFHSILVGVANLWLSEDAASSDEEIEEMAAFILSSGSFGNAVNGMAAKMNREAAKNQTEDVSRVKMLLRYVFPTVSHIKMLYPSVKKCILLYPFCVVHRFFKILFCRTKEIKKLSAVMNTDKENMITFEQHCEKMGLSKDL